MFGLPFQDIIKVRNTVVHGVCLGEKEDGRWAFLTNEPDQPYEGQLVSRVRYYGPVDIAARAWVAEKTIPLLVKILNFGALRQARREQPLQTHQDRQRSKTLAARRKHQRPASPE
jgi:hypothetical protein